MGRTWAIPLFSILLLLASLAVGAESFVRKAPTDSEGRFYNPWPGGERRTFADFLKWKFASRNPFAKDKQAPVVFPVEEAPLDSLESAGRDYIVWLGHSTVLMKANGKRIITDPVFWDVNLLIKRKTPLPIEPEKLPKIDIVLISHGHYDHLNTRTIKFLKEKHDPHFVAGPGYEDYFASLGIRKYIPLNWTETYAAGGVKVTSLPVQHWSKRTFSDSNRMLWTSFLIEHRGKKYYWASDTGYFQGFKEVGALFGPIDIAMLPIGSYEPRWFMKDNHMNPEEALQAATDLKAKVFIPIHWGTFDLTDEPLWLPVKRLKEIYDTGAGPELRLLEHGGFVTD